MRRRFLMGAGALLAAPFARAQQPDKVWRIGFLGPSSAARTERRVEPKMLARADRVIE